MIWVVFGINFFWTLAQRNEPSLCVALWFYIATIITVAMLYIVNHLSIPTNWTHSYPIFGGVQDALVQWWYGHNAVAFFLTTPILGIMYYFLPKAAERPVTGDCPRFFVLGKSETLSRERTPFASWQKARISPISACPLPQQKTSAKDTPRMTVKLAATI